MKSLLRCGMGPCQGRLCGLTVTELIATARGVPPGEVGYYRLRPPIKPITLGELASLPPTDAACRRWCEARRVMTRPTSSSSAAACTAARPRCISRTVGRRVSVIEKDYVGRHASGVNAGGVRRLGRDVAEIPLSVASLELWHRIADLVDDDCGFERHGQVKVAENAAELEALRRRAAELRALGFAHEEVIDRAELRRAGAGDRRALRRRG